MTEKFHKKVVSKLPSNYQQAYQDCLVLKIDNLVKMLRESVGLSDYDAVFYYLNQASNILGEKPPLNERDAGLLFEVLFALVSSCNHWVVLKKSIVVLATFVGRKEWMKESGIESIDWRVLFDRYQEVCQNKWVIPGYTGDSTSRAMLRRNFSMLIQRSRKYFTLSAVDEIFEYVSPTLTLHDSRLFESVSILTLFIPVTNNNYQWIDRAIVIWGWIHNNRVWDSCWITLFSRLAKEHAGDIDWTPYQQFFVSKFIQTTSLASGSANLSNLSSNNFPSFYNYGEPGMNLDKLLAYTISNTSQSIETFEQIMGQISSYFHPANEGKWTILLITFLRRFVYHLINRLELEKEGKRTNVLSVNQDFTEKILDILLPIVESALSIEGRTSVIPYLAKLNPERVYNTFTKRIYFSLTTDSAIKQISPGINASAILVPLAYKTELFKKNFVKLLFLTLPGIDINDFEKTIKSFKYFYSVFMYHKISDDLNEIYECESDRFSEWATMFIDQIFIFLENIRDDSSDTFSYLFAQTMRLFFFQISESIYDMLLSKISHYIQTNVNSLALKYFGQIVCSLVRANPVKALAEFTPRMEKTISSKGKLKGNSSKVIWNLNLISKMTRFSGDSILPLLPTLKKIIDLAIVDQSKKVSHAGRKILAYSLKALTQYYPLEYGSISNTGDSTFEWHQPSEHEISSAKDVANHFVQIAVKNLNSILNNPEQSYLIERYTSVLKTVLVSAAVLFKSLEGEPGYIYGVERKTIPYNILDTENLIEVDGVISVAHKLAKFIEEVDIPTQIRSIFKLIIVLLSQRNGAQKHKGLKGMTNMLKHSYGMYGWKTKDLPRVFQIDTALSKHYFVSEDQSYYNFSNKKYEDLLKDLISLYSVHFGALKNATQSVSNCMRLLPLNSGNIIHDLISRLSTESSTDSDNEIKSIVSLLSDSYLISRICRNPKYSYQLMQAILDSSIHNKGTEQKEIFKLFNTYCSSYNSLYLENEPVLSISVYETTAERVKNELSKRNEKVEELLTETCTKINSVITGNEHWRYQFMASVFLLLQYGTNDTINNLCEDVSLILLRSAQLPKQIDIAIQFAAIVAKQNKKKDLKKLLHVEKLQTISFNPTEISDYENFDFIDTLYSGWNSSNDVKIQSLSYNDRYSAKLKSLFSDLDFTVRFLERIQQNRNEEKKSGGSGMQGIPHMFHKMMGGQREKSSQPEANFKKRNTFLKSKIPVTKYHGNLMNLTFWRLIFDICGSSYLTLIKDHLLYLLNQNEEDIHVTVSEVFGGALRSLKYVSNEDFQPMTDGLIDILNGVKKSEIGTDAISDFGLAIRFGVSDLDPRRFVWLQDTLFNDLLNEKEKAQSQSKNLRLLDSVITEFSWRGNFLMARVLYFLSDRLDNQYAQVRENIATLLATISSVSMQVAENQTVGSRNIINDDMILKFIIGIATTLQTNKNSTFYYETVLRFLNLCIKNESITPQITFSILPKILELQSEQEQTIRDLSKAIFSLLSQVTLYPSELKSLLEILSQISTENDWKQFGPLCLFIRMIAFNHSVLFDNEDIEKLFNFIINLFKITKLEVANAAQEALGSLTRIFNVRCNSITEENLHHFIEQVETPILKNNKKDSLREIRKGLLGLTGLSLSAPYSIPVWLPEVIVRISSFTTSQRPLNRIANESLKEFWRTHQDESWEMYYAEHFTDEQLNLIHNTTTPSYFA